MKVKDLIKKLENANPDLPVYLYSEQDDQVTGFNILNIGVTNGEPLRKEDGSVSIRFGKNESSIELLCIEVTSDT